MNLLYCMTQARALAGIMHGGRAFGGPLQASVQLTNRCNLKCLHCYYHSPLLSMPNTIELRRAKQKGEEITPKLVQHFKNLQADSAHTRRNLDGILAMGTPRFQFSGNGEPFLHENAMEFVARVKHAGAYCNTNTNGVVLRRHEADDLIKMGFDDLRISVLAGDRETYARTHGGSDGREFDRLRKNLTYLFDRKRALGVSRPLVQLAFVVFAQNHDGIEKFSKFVTEIGADHVIMRVFDDVDVPEYETARLTPAMTALAKEQLIAARAHFNANKVQHNIENVLQVFHGRLNTATLHNRMPCYYGWLVTRIDVDGKVYPCCRCYQAIGDTNEMDIRDIWYGRKYREFRQVASSMHRDGRAPDCDCAHCVHHNANQKVYGLLHPFKARKSSSSVLPVPVPDAIS